MLNTPGTTNSSRGRIPQESQTLGYAWICPNIDIVHPTGQCWLSDGMESLRKRRKSRRNVAETMMR